MTYKPLRIALAKIGVLFYAQINKGITIYIFPTNQPKTISLSVFLLYPFLQDKPKFMFLQRILTQGCKKYVNERKIHVHLEQIYANYFNSQILEISNTLLLNFELSVISDRFLPKKINSAKRGLKFLKEVLFNPVKQDKCFHKNKNND
jgi:hypothetical protein